METIINEVIDFMAQQKTTIADLRTRLSTVSEEYQNFQLEEANEEAAYTALQERLAAGLAAAAE